MKLLILGKREVERLLPMQKCIELMEDALTSLARGEVILPLRPVLRIPDTQNVFALMPAYSKSLRAIGTKLITAEGAISKDVGCDEFELHGRNEGRETNSNEERGRSRLPDERRGSRTGIASTRNEGPYTARLLTRVVVGSQSVPTSRVLPTSLVRCDVSRAPSFLVRASVPSTSHVPR